MGFYYILIYILFRFPPGKWVPLGQTVKGGSKYSDFFTGIQWPLLGVLLISAAIISDTALYEDLVLLREGWDEFTSSHPSLQVSTVLSSHEVAEKVYPCNGPPSLPHPYIKTRKSKFFIDIPLGNPSVELKQLLDSSAQFNEEIKAAKEMADQVLVRDLPFENMDGDNDPPPLNVESCHFKNSRCRHCHLIVSPNN